LNYFSRYGWHRIFMALKWLIEPISLQLISKKSSHLLDVQKVHLACPPFHITCPPFHITCPPFHITCPPIFKRFILFAAHIFKKRSCFIPCILKWYSVCVHSTQKSIQKFYLQVICRWTASLLNPRRLTRICESCIGTSIKWVK